MCSPPARKHRNFIPRVVFGLCFLVIGALLAVISLSASPSSLVEQSTDLQLDTGAKPKDTTGDLALRDWFAKRSPDAIDGYLGNPLGDVACPSSSDCWAVGRVGTYISRTLAEHWDGISWSVVPSPNSNPTENDNALDAITCLSAQDCWAVGLVENGSSERTLIEHWNGSSWSIVNSPQPSGTVDSLFFDVSCISASDCWAVGRFDTGGHWQTLIEHWNGVSWSIVSSPNVASSWSNYLYGIACVSAQNCWAVGYFKSPDFITRTLVEHWDGISWSIVASPNNLGDYNWLYSVDCSSVSDCWAVGYSDSGIDDTYQTLIEHWDGASWSIVSSPNVGTTAGNFLRAVTCISAQDCWAVGSAENYDVDDPLTEHWDGVSWSIVPSPSSGFRLPLLSVACASSKDCWAVGSVTQHWDGKSWSMVATPPLLNSVVSRKQHGSAGTFDVNLPLADSTGIECRSGGMDENYQLVFTFMDTVGSVDGVSTTAGKVSTSSNGPQNDQYTVNLTAVPNAQYLTVTLEGVHTGTNIGNASHTMGVLIGDTSGDGNVNTSDVAQTKSRIGQAVGATNFRSDVNANGVINASDAGLVKSNIGSGLP